MYAKIVSIVNKGSVPLTPSSKKTMPALYKTTTALKTRGVTGLAYGVAGFVLLCYVTEWRAVLQYLPYYNGKYKELDLKDQADKVEQAHRMANASRDFAQERQDLQNKTE
ncbi:Cytochrome b-c1 complex subunit 10 [Cinara cedri]|uniref:Cytochrome b-c1 complex subunit 10 n=1 Tax=Cinara cedri TaxID=506608 RepID=A0A5E4NPQ8_9HEMI|nr:Cytochrome b-c1 complex subunit 10 [Cinara cedri]